MSDPYSAPAPDQFNLRETTGSSDPADSYAHGSGLPSRCHLQPLPSAAGSIRSCQPIEVSDKGVETESCRVTRRQGPNHLMTSPSLINCHVSGFCTFLSFMLEASLKSEDSNNLSQPLWVIIPKLFFFSKVFLLPSGGGQRYICGHASL